ncbi:MAG: hypothetical protein MUE73_11365 [Planctomycetes bacterium]|nr:hypothetical protein [Planctomycetota bacterium]
MRSSVAVVTAALLLAASTAALAQRAPPSQEDLKKSRDAKYVADWFKTNPWTADYDKARETAKAEKKLILAYFLPSYFN